MRAASDPWPPLPPQACLGVIAPAGPPRGDSLAQVQPLMARLGFRAKLFPGCAGPAHLGHLAASDAQRLADQVELHLDTEKLRALCGLG